MVFSSNFFLLYFLPLFLILFLIIPKIYKNYFILFASILFYIWGAPKFIFILIPSLVVDFYLAKIIDLTEGRIKKCIFILNLILNIGLLCIFKYTDFILSNLNIIRSLQHQEQFSLLNIILPIGISFITFQKISYATDIYLKKNGPFNRFDQYALYILLFPHSIAGPIVRYHEIAPQIQGEKPFDTVDDKVEGLLRFIKGLAKKVLIANTLGSVADQIFQIPANELSTINSWIGSISYTFQIYFDFSGYSDMAIGVARFMGFKFPENFNRPYLAKSISEFWERWHISLSSWLKEYIYIPLGGNRKGKFRMYLHLLIVFLISGFWHGAQWTFVIWGLYHGILIIIDKLFLNQLLKKCGTIISTSVTFILITIGFVFFRAENFTNALLFLKSMAGYGTDHDLIFLNYRFIFFFITASLICFIPGLTNSLPSSFSQLKFNSKLVLPLRVVTSVLFIWLCISQIASSDFNPFIYFRF